MRLFLLVALQGCLEKVTGEEVPLDARFTAQATPSSEGSDDTGAPKHQEQQHVEVAHEEAPPPQPFAGVEGEKVSITGVIHSELAGPVDLDVALVDKKDPSGLVSVGKLIFDGPGEFSLDVPLGVGSLHLAAFQDLDKDGPSEQDPYAEDLVQVEADAIGNVVLTLIAGARSTSMSGPKHTTVPPPQPFTDVQGDRITISGVILSEQAGPVDIDVGRIDESSPGGLINEGKHIIEEPGKFSFDVPENTGGLRLAAFQDLDRDGPSQKDPYAELEVDVGSQSIDGLTFTLVVGARVQGIGGGGPQHVEAPPGFGSGQTPPPDGSATQADLFDDAAGERVAVSGLIVWDGEQSVDLDLFTPDTSVAGGRRLLGKLKKNVGAFRIKAPVSIRVLELDAFADLTGDGPTADDPRATIRNIDLSKGPVEGVQVLLTTLQEEAPQPTPVGAGTDIEEEFAKTAGSGPATNEGIDGQ